MAFFNFDFRNANKRLPSVLTELSGSLKPPLRYSIQTLLPDQRPIYLIMDALDESPITSRIPSARESVLQLLKELIDLGPPSHASDLPYEGPASCSFPATFYQRKLTCGGFSDALRTLVTHQYSPPTPVAAPEATNHFSRSFFGAIEDDGNEFLQIWERS
jgi:hypothetical protein